MNALRPTGRILAGLTAGLGLLLGMLLPVTLAAAAPHPSVELSATTLTPGMTVVINGAGFPPGVGINVSLCGASGRGGSGTCVLSATEVIVATSRGVIWTSLRVAVPPVPCPCDVVFAGTETSLHLTVPVTVAGMVTATTPSTRPPSGPRLDLSDVRVVGGDPIPALLGASAPRMLLFSLSNSGTVPTNVTLVGRWGGSAPLNAIRMPQVGTMQAHATRSFAVTFGLGALALGSYRISVRAEAEDGGRVASTTSVTTQWPILLLALEAAVIVFLVAVAVMFLRRRKRFGNERTTDDEETAGSLRPEAAVDEPTRLGLTQPPLPDVLAREPV